MCIYIYIYTHLYAENNVIVTFFCVTILSLNPAGYSLHVESYTCQSSYKREKNSSTKNLIKNACRHVSKYTGVRMYVLSLM